MINKIIENGEEIIYNAKANPSKTSIQIFRIIIILVVLTLFYYVLFTTYNGEDLTEWCMALVVLFVLTIFSIYGIIYNLLLKNKYKNSQCYITNKRVILIAKAKVEFNSIENISMISIAREKRNYGEIIFYFNVDEQNILNNFIKDADQVKSISFCGVENPRNLIAIIQKINKNVLVFDDRPKVFGKSI